MAQTLKNTPEREEIKTVLAGDYSDEVGTRVVKIEDGTEEIGENAFRAFEHLEEIFIP